MHCCVEYDVTSERQLLSKEKKDINDCSRIYIEIVYNYFKFSSFKDAIFNIFLMIFHVLR